VADGVVLSVFQEGKEDVCHRKIFLAAEAS
jgi:hypothetical protein